MRPLPEFSSFRCRASHFLAPDILAMPHFLPPAVPSTDALLAAIVNSSSDAILSKDLDGNIMSWNQGAERIFGYTADEVIGQPVTLLFPTDRLDEEPNILARIRRGERVDHYETVRRHKDGTLVDVSLTVSPVTDAGGRVVGASSIARNITALKEARRQLEAHAMELEQRVRERTARLEESLAEFEAFSYSLSHDMRAPLRAIQSLTEVVVTDYGDRIPEGVAYLRKVIFAANRLDRLIRDVLSFARISRSDIALQRVDVESLVQDIVAERPELQPGNAEILVASPLAPVIGHDASLTQCLSNLLDNAVKFVAPGVKPIVNVFTERVGDKVRIGVRDNGIGIDPHGKKRLFDLFARVAPRGSYEGTGVGLAIVRKAVSRMHGQIGVESSLGLGSTFWIELPAANP